MIKNLIRSGERNCFLDQVVADATGLQGHQTVAVGLPDPPAVQHCLVELQLPREEHLRVAVQHSLTEPRAPRDEPIVKTQIQPKLN